MKKGATLMADPINELTNQIYKNIALRILNRKEQLKKKRTDITDDNSVSMLSNVMHNKRIPNRNPYLLNHKIICDIVSKLNFKSAYYLIWGENKELESTLETLFKYGLKYLQEESDLNKKLIENCLLEYLPYAKLTAELEYSFEPFKPNREDVVSARSTAIEHLYYGILSYFKEEHKKFFEEKETSKFTQNIIHFISKNMFELLKQYLNERDNQGQKAYSIMSKILSYESENEFDNISHGPEWFPYQPLTNSERPVMEIRQEVVDAGNKYIDAIVNEQKELDPFYLENPYFI